MPKLLNLEPGDVLFLSPAERQGGCGAWINLAGQRLFGWRRGLSDAASFSFTHVAIATVGNGILDAVPKEDQTEAHDGAIRYGDDSLFDDGGYYDFERCLVVRPPSVLRHALGKEVSEAWTYYGPVYPRLLTFFNTIVSRPGESSPAAFYRPIGSPQPTVYCSQFVAHIYWRAIQCVKKAGWQAKEFDRYGKRDWVDIDVPVELRGPLDDLATRLADTSRALPVFLWDAFQAPLFTRGPLTETRFDNPQETSNHLTIRRAMMISNRQTLLDQAQVLSAKAKIAIGVAELFRKGYEVAALAEVDRPAWEKRMMRGASPRGVEDADRIAWTLLRNGIAIATDDLLLALQELRNEEGSTYLTGGLFDIALFKVRCVAITARTSLRSWLQRLEAYARAIDAGAAGVSDGSRAKDPGVAWATRSGEEAVGTLRKLAQDLVALGMDRAADELAANGPRLAAMPEDDPRVATALTEARDLTAEALALAEPVKALLRPLSEVQDLAALRHWAREATSRST